MNHDILGIVNHGIKDCTVYLFDEQVGPKNTDHTLSYLTDFAGKLLSWIRRIHIFLDNTASTNKNFYTTAWGYEMVKQKRLDFLQLSFLIAGHTKFSLDLFDLISKIAQSYNRSDVFTTEELKEVISLYAEVVIDEGMLVCDWRNPLSKKFSKHPGIRSQHDFVFAMKPNGTVEEKVCELCYTGPYEDSSSPVLQGQNVSA